MNNGVSLAWKVKVLEEENAVLRKKLEIARVKLAILRGKGGSK